MEVVRLLHERSRPGPRGGGEAAGQLGANVETPDGTRQPRQPTSRRQGPRGGGEAAGRARGERRDTPIGVTTASRQPTSRRRTVGRAVETPRNDGTTPLCWPSSGRTSRRRWTNQGGESDPSSRRNVTTYLKKQIKDAKNLKIAYTQFPKIFEYTGPSRGGKKHKTKKHKTKKNRQKHKKTKQKRLH